jgi:uncharacterized protein YyaL (SSP411 family)
MVPGRLAFLLRDLRRYYLSGNRYFKNMDAGPKQKKLAIAHGVNWLLLAQKSTPDDGMGSYHLINGWSASYPETTGYIIPTLLEYASERNDRNIVDAAIHAADWLIAIQRPSGGWQGGRVNENKAEIVFNTAQIIRGMMALYRVVKDEKYLQSACRAGDWLCSIQDKSGTWTRFALMGQARVYDSYVDYPLLMLHHETGLEKYRNAAILNLNWIVDEKQQPNAWFMDCDNTVKRNDKPILHTIAYTIDGLLDCGIYLGERKYTEAAVKAANVLMEKFMRDGYLHGRYDRHWQGSEHMILTGCAQMSVIWMKIAYYAGNRNYHAAAARMNNLLVKLQSRHGMKHAFGAVSGSYPLWGRYEPFSFPNWATKYLVDALMTEEKNK